jgi:microcystin-dependent protein
MAQPYVGEIRLFAGNFAPLGWQSCDGSLIPIEENEALYQLIGTTYGGDGQSNFAVPDLRGRTAMHFGTGASGVNHQVGETAGTEQVTLTSQQIPNHTHAFAASTSPGSVSGPQNAVLGSAPGVTMFIRDAPGTPLPANLVAPSGGSQPHSNLMPTLTMKYIISLFGVFPSPT